ncbi:MAG: PKD domain-containing protein [Myxococcota bacterium]
MLTSTIVDRIPVTSAAGLRRRTASGSLALLLAWGVLSASASARADCSLTSVGIPPLSDNAAGFYRGFPGGLYPGGFSTAPPEHLARAVTRAGEVEPLDANGAPSAAGQIVFVSVGMSNTRSAFNGFVDLWEADAARNPRLLVVNGAQDTQTAADWMDADAPTWGVLDALIGSAGGTPQQVQVAWVKLTDDFPAANGEFPAHAELLQSRLEAVARSLLVRFPNLKIAWFSSRTRAYTDEANALSPEPYAYESGFSVRWMIEKQLAGDASLEFDPARGAVVAPLLLWGPYLWIDGTVPRSDGLQWLCNDLAPVDFIHPSNNGVAKVGAQLYSFFKSHPAATPWALDPVAIGSRPTCSVSATPASGDAPLAVDLRANANDADGSVVEWAWSFGDGTGSLAAAPSKIFPAEDAYPIHLTVTDDEGDTGACEAVIQVPEAARLIGGLAALATTLGAIAVRRRFPDQTARR